MGLHVAGRLVGLGHARTAAIDHRPRGAVELGDRHHHRGLDRLQPAIRSFPLGQRLELERVGRDIRHIEAGQDVFGRLGVVVGGTTDQREAGERDDRVDGGCPVLEEIPLDRRAGVEPGGEGRHHLEPSGLESGDDAVIMAAITSQHVGAHHQEADPALLGPLGRDTRQLRQILGHPALELRVIEAELGMVDRQLGVQRAAQHLPGASRVAVDQPADHVGDVLVRAGEPVLHREEIGAQVLGRARHEAQDLRQPAQHGHLPAHRRSAGCLRASASGA